MDTLEIEFKRLLRSDQCDAAHKALDRWAEKSSPLPARLAHWRAATFRREGKYDRAVSTLTQVIDAQKDSNELCRVARASIYLQLARWLDALADYEIILNSDLPVVKRSFQSSARFMKAYILARLGRTQFRAAIEGVEVDQKDFVVDRILDRGALIRLYESASNSIRP